MAAREPKIVSYSSSNHCYLHYLYGFTGFTNSVFRLLQYDRFNKNVPVLRTAVVVISLLAAALYFFSLSLLILRFSESFVTTKAKCKQIKMRLMLQNTRSLYSQFCIFLQFFYSFLYPTCVLF